MNGVSDKLFSRNLVSLRGSSSVYDRSSPGAFSGRSISRPRSIAWLIAASNSSSRQGFVRNSKAPAFIARTLIGMSP